MQSSASSHDTAKEIKAPVNSGKAHGRNDESRRQIARHRPTSGPVSGPGGQPYKEIGLHLKCMLHPPSTPDDTSLDV